MKKKMNYAVTNDSDNRSERVELPQYAPYNDVTADYVISQKLRAFEHDFEDMCRDFIGKSSPDRNNGTYYDAVIDKYCDEAIIDISLQRQDHIQLISQRFAGYQKGIRVKIEAKLQMVMDALAEIEAELAKCKHIYFKGTSMED